MSCLVVLSHISANFDDFLHSTFLAIFEVWAVLKEGAVATASDQLQHLPFWLYPYNTLLLRLLTALHMLFHIVRKTSHPTEICLSKDCSCSNLVCCYVMRELVVSALGPPHASEWRFFFPIEDRDDHRAQSDGRLTLA